MSSPQMMTMLGLLLRSLRHRRRAEGNRRGDDSGRYIDQFLHSHLTLPSAATLPPKRDPIM